jgi:hypothetical protein
MSVMKAHDLQMFESDFAEGLRHKFKLRQPRVDFLQFFTAFTLDVYFWRSSKECVV